MIRSALPICNRCAEIEDRRYGCTMPGRTPRPDNLNGIIAQFERGYREFLKRRGMIPEEGWAAMPLFGKGSIAAQEIRRNKLRAYIRKRQLELGEDPEEFRNSEPHE